MKLDTQTNRLENEWNTLQNQYDSYEKCSLAIKLVSIVTCCLLLFVWHTGIWTLSVIPLFWLQDAIWKTFQARIGQRLEAIEKTLQTSQEANTTGEGGMQFNLNWAQTRPNAFGLILEYLIQSLKPTVAFPYLALLLLTIVYCCAG